MTGYSPQHPAERLEPKPSTIVAPGPGKLSIALVNPRLPPGFHGFDFALPIIGNGVRAAMAPPALPLLAALVPEGHEVVLFDENIEEIDAGALRRFDIIGMTGMLVQRPRMLSLLQELRDLPGLLVVGGPAVTADESPFERLCDVRFVGEAEQTWPEFIECVAAGKRSAGRYEQGERTDMSTVPVPRYDLLRRGVYWRAAVQFSRGCPFLCEFCDIITQFGRRPRLKSPAQVLAEFEAVLKAGFSSCFLVDDNFIANKNQAKALLKEIVRWQRERRYPLRLTTQASLNLAEDPELMELMAEANFSAVFIGIESPRQACLEEVRKNQNIHAVNMLERIRRVRDHGLVVLGGFIVGFDHDDMGIFEEQFDFIERSGIAQASIAILQPIPSTPLHARLRDAGRLSADVRGVEFRPLQMSAEELVRGYEGLIRRLYDPHVYFGRLYRGYCESEKFRQRQRTMGATGRARTLIGTARGAVATATLLWRLLGHLRRKGRLGSLGAAYLAIYRKQNRPLGRQALSLQQFLSQCAQHWHFTQLFEHDQIRFLSHDGPQKTGADRGDWGQEEPGIPMALRAQPLAGPGTNPARRAVNET